MAARRLSKIACVVSLAGLLPVAAPLGAASCTCPWLEIANAHQPAECPTHAGCCGSCGDRVPVCAPPGGIVTVAATFGYGVPAQDCDGPPCQGTRRFFMYIQDVNESEEPPYDEGFLFYIQDLSPGQSGTTTLSFDYEAWPVDNHNAYYGIDATNLSTGALEDWSCDKCCYRIECL